MGFLSFEFFFRLLWGWNLYLLLVSRQESSEKFLRVSLRFSFGFASVAALSSLYSQVGRWDLITLACLFVGAASYLSQRFVFLRAAGLLLILCSPLLLFMGRDFLSVANAFLSAAVLGGAFFGQFLGHWYLNVPNIHISQFKRVTKFAIYSLVLRFLWLVVLSFLYKKAPETMGFVFSDEAFSLKGDGIMGLGTFGLILLGSRVLWGLVTPMILTLMAKKTVDMRSTQSATGIFYANTVLLLLGELTALYLEKELKWPF